MSVVEVDNIWAAFRMLLSKRVVVVLSPVIRADLTLKSLPSADKEQIRRLAEPMVSLPLFAAFVKKRNLEKTRDLFDQKLRDLKKSGEVGRIIAKWIR